VAFDFLIGWTAFIRTVLFKTQSGTKHHGDKKFRVLEWHRVMMIFFFEKKKNE